MAAEPLLRRIAPLSPGGGGGKSPSSTQAGGSYYSGRRVATDYFVNGHSAAANGRTSFLIRQRASVSGIAFARSERSPREARRVSAIISFDRVTTTGSTSRRLYLAEADHALSCGRSHGGGDDAVGLLRHLPALPHRLMPIVPDPALFDCIFPAGMIVNSLSSGRSAAW